MENRTAQVKQPARPWYSGKTTFREQAELCLRSGLSLCVLWESDRPVSRPES